jgi:2,3-bisphosphoglycerate-independent phosphoglycerate mutase
MTNKLILLILDGWGINPDPKVSAIAAAHTPFMDSLLAKQPHATLVTYGEAVGLPHGQMGNSEVGHLNIGAGRIVWQELLRINNALHDGELEQNATLRAAIQYAKTEQRAIHLVGLVSDGGVHSHINHLKGLCSILHREKVDKTYIHAFTDGRDTDPHKGKAYIADLLAHTAQTTGTIASIIGRYYGMDRDKRWERVKLAYDLLGKRKRKALYRPPCRHTSRLRCQYKRRIYTAKPNYPSQRASHCHHTAARCGYLF